MEKLTTEQIIKDMKAIFNDQDSHIDFYKKDMKVASIKFEKVDKNFDLNDYIEFREENDSTISMWVNFEWTSSGNFVFINFDSYAVGSI